MKIKLLMLIVYVVSLMYFKTNHVQMQKIDLKDQTQDTFVFIQNLHMETALDKHLYPPCLDSSTSIP